MRFFNRITPFLLICSLIYFTSCSDDSEEVTSSEDDMENEEEGMEEEEAVLISDVPDVLIEATKVFVKTSGDITSVLSLSGLDLPFDKIRYDVTMYRITYKSVYKGDSIATSGIVFVPNTTESISTMSFQHGTVASDAEVPSNLAINDGSLTLYAGLASAGFLTSVPDFIGFGTSVDIMHPYYHEFYTANSVVNSIYAAKQLLEQIDFDDTTQTYSLDKELYLAGYSQGGYATMATHKYFEEEGMDYFDLVASFPSSGGYDIKGVQDFFFEQEVYHQPFFLAYVAMSFKTSYDWTESLNLFFNEPYASRIPDLFDGSFTGSQINDQLNDTISVYLTSDFLNSDGDPTYDFVFEAFAENSLIDWAPKIRMFMYHGDADITVPYQNSVDSYNQLIANGASEDIVTFKAFPGGTHGTGVGPYIENFITEITGLEE